MTLRPVDSTGDILPVLSTSVLLRGADAVAQLIHDRLRLLQGEWWENPSWGCEILEMLRSSRLTEVDGDALSAYLSSYVRETPGVETVENAAYTVSGRRFSWSCTAQTRDGSTNISYDIDL